MVGMPDIDFTQSHHHPGAQLCMESIRSWSVYLKRPMQGTPREGSGSLSMQPVGYTPW